ncbi:exonuclease, putative [Trypanosoma brucei gambiense DAL972]|uniref:Exonuclease, putative n=1 Tax=Trypanosoma brucei gambiense (strain MHOM/CI/86/DAL972) TaxID=679716 RepID=C9ZKM3_TRYB9|nr:exonuclease, putative [Trypanosoma brucei gambiense DAL972]CBH10239.1 exonuclease, putative [Trypanosoma brucei gambiense DAL972]|eukprot:XP_011772529.1 exonuclease, putative [Trypanosoma brucei gambiense DAL972]
MVSCKATPERASASSNGVQPQAFHTDKCYDAGDITCKKMAKNEGDGGLSQRKNKPRGRPQPFSHLLVCDFEATCDADSAGLYPHEIIEFPVVCIDTAQLAVVAEFHSYVHPVRRPKLTAFCKELTGITQSVVDDAPTLPEVIQKFGQWVREVVYPLCKMWKQQYPPSQLASNCLGDLEKKFKYDEKDNKEWVGCERMVCFTTDGPWDMRKFMHECSVVRDGHIFPPLFYRWVDVRKCFKQHFNKWPRKLVDMLRTLRLDFEGKQHSGIDDSRNIARILIELMRRGFFVRRVSTIEYKCPMDVGGVILTQEMRELCDEENAKAKQRHLRE